jgi:hypothetical protein
MSFSNRGWLIGCAAAVVLSLSSPAHAVTVFCSLAGDGIAGFSLTTANASTCVGTGSPNDINNGVPATLPGYTLLDKSDDGTTGTAGWLNAIVLTGAGTPSGTFSINVGAGYTSLVLAFRDGQDHEDGYGAFLLGNLTGSWAIINPAQNLSHMTLYGVAASAVPGPIVGAGLPGLVIAVGGFVAWTRRRKATSAA